MTGLIVAIYRFLFARRIFYRLNDLVYQCGLRGMGILNYESGEISGEKRFLSHYLKGKENCVVFDVGANVGKYSAEIFKANPTAVIYAFEPHPKTFQTLTAGIRHANFHPNNFALGDENGTLPLYDYADRDGSSHASLFKDVIEKIHEAKSVRHDVQVTTLHSFIEGHGIGVIDLLKIDTEGNELNVLKGGLEYLRSGKVKAVHFEFNEMNLSSRTYFKDFWEILPNFVFYRLLPDGAIRLPIYAPIVCEIFAYQNIVAVLKEEDGKSTRGRTQF
jgi:FkbM family methyltransferase